MGFAAIRDSRQEVQTYGPQGPSMFDTIGSTADEVADRLRELRIRGVPNTVASLNPIGKYVDAQVTLDAIVIDLSNGTLTITFPSQRTHVIALPQPVVDFLHGFNEGAYPDLIMDLERHR